MKLPATILSGAFAALAANAAPAPDPYIWLEEVSSPRALAWVEAENARTTGVFEKDPRYAGLFADALKIAEATDRIPNPDLIGGAVTNFWQDAAHVRGIWRTTSIAGYRAAAPAWQTLLDLDALSTAEEANWVWKGVQCEPLAERRCLVSLSDGGEDATTVREFDLATRQFVPGGFSLPTSKQDVSWETPDSLLVARDWGPGTMTSSGYPFVVKRLQRGRKPEAAVEVFRGEPTDVAAGPLVLVDGKGNRVTGMQRGISFFENAVYLYGKAGLTKVDAPPKSRVEGLLDGRLIMSLQQDWPVAGKAALPSGSIVAVDAVAAATGKPLSPQLIFTPNARQSVDSVHVTKTSVLAAIYDNVRGRAYTFTPTGSGWRETRLALPDNASVDVAATERTSDDAFLMVTGYLVPTTMWLADGSAKPVQVKTLAPRFDASGLVTEQFEAVSKDGTRIPYFITHRRDIRLDGSTPTILDAYGGFQVSSTPYYSGVIGKLWLERGGAFAVANIRGGGEFGPAWHDAALKTKRQTAYDDFAAVGEDLIRRKLTSARRLGITGGSNGGLLMGVEMTQRPDLWHAVNINVPLLDMLRFEKIAAGASWVGEYGSVANPDERAFWEKTSPYEALKPGVAYPEPYIFTTTKDDRVGPVHARKFAARMKEFGLPYTYYENTEGGHGSGANLKQTARTNALEMIYFTRKLMD
ncbi:prolyl oligopeptidase family serine peptidase [Glacieibacterium sp.]|uniref:prolyl oligopeptidase family serine peptidase n=1 Tax=Glacieibacterium sp. TaxID=2860237 RepID=UPI003AFF7F87